MLPSEVWSSACKFPPSKAKAQAVKKAVIFFIIVALKLFLLCSHHGACGPRIASVITLRHLPHKINAFKIQDLGFNAAGRGIGLHQCMRQNR
jgi:hypothetical protein